MMRLSNPSRERLKRLEGFRAKAYIPVPGDVPTIGSGVALNRREYGFFNIPSAFYPSVDALVVNPHKVGPFREGVSLAACGKIYGSPFVSRLHGVCSPSAIMAVVRAIYVNTIKRMRLGWGLSHIKKEVLKSLPTLTNFDAAPTIVFVRSIAGVQASLFHQRPSVVLLSSFPVVGIATLPVLEVSDA